jgi:superfamily II DNA or RNA helicase/HKD family nuclease
MSATLAYYNDNAEAFFADTVGVDMSALHDRFLATLSAGAIVLDAGCGSGRDARAFLERGFRVCAFDASVELAQRAALHAGIAVALRTFDDVREQSCYDGIWACASLLHLPEAAIPAALAQLWAALRPGGTFYMSFKLGSGERFHNGRHFTDVTQVQLRSWLADLPDLGDIECWLSSDQRPGRAEQWLNAIVLRTAPAPDRLITGGPDPFLPHLCAAMKRATEVELAVAFVKSTGLRLLLPDLHDVLERDDSRAGAQARVRILTSDYLGVTDPEALRMLMLLQALGAQVRVHEAAGGSFHLKAYLLARLDAVTGLSGTAFIGSSNISRQALQHGLEWNVRIDYPAPGFLEARARFDELFAHPNCKVLTHAWIDAYELRRIKLPFAVSPGSLEQEPPPQPTTIQLAALAALKQTRADGFKRALVVLATGLGKTWLAAFDAAQAGAKRILFVAHREEILNQAAATFLHIRPGARVGFFMGETRDTEVDVLCASVQTLSRSEHLEQFSRQHFDYIIIDEFHHAAAATYRRLLHYFEPRFLLGLTATPERSDQSDILSLCDDNLAFTCGLFEGIRSGLLAPFHYFGIFDDTVDYSSLPWRNGRFDPEQLSSKLATLGRARHALKEWLKYKQQRTLAFCVSISHAEFMATQFRNEGVACAAVHSNSTLSRADALERLRDGRLSIIFSVDLFNEGVDLPALDTVMMLRPTESKILFLQQLGRGLRNSAGKEKLVVLDFIGNHRSFLHKPQALFEVGANYRQLADFARQVEHGKISLPDGCFIHYDLRLIEFLKSLDGDSIQKEYQALRDVLERRPTLAEFYRAGASLPALRKQYGGWFKLVEQMGDMDQNDLVIATAHQAFFAEIETTAMTKSFKMVLLEALQELDGWRNPPLIATLAAQSWQVLQRRRALLTDLPIEQKQCFDGSDKTWQQYWAKNPVKAWTGANLAAGASSFFSLVDGRFQPSFVLLPEQRERFEAMLQELIDCRLAAYATRQPAIAPVAIADNVIALRQPASDAITLPYFANLKIACGHFKASASDAIEYRTIATSHGHLDPKRHVLARASGNSMNGGKQPIQDGDFLLLELLSPANAGSLTGSVVAIERQDATGDGSEYLLRKVLKSPAGGYLLRANNPDYADIPATDDMATRARLKGVISALEMAVGQPFMRKDIPALFGAIFNTGSWTNGHIALAEQKAHVLLVTLNKQGRAQEQRYLDHWVDDTHFHWQSQNQTTPNSKRGQEIIGHEKLGIAIHLFIRENKLRNGKAAPFIYQGQVRYQSHAGSSPMSVMFESDAAMSPD